MVLDTGAFAAAGANFCVLSFTICGAASFSLASAVPEADSFLEVEPEGGFRGSVDAFR